MISMVIWKLENKLRAILQSYMTNIISIREVYNHGIYPQRNPAEMSDFQNILGTLRN